MFLALHDQHCKIERIINELNSNYKETETQNPVY